MRLRGLGLFAILLSAAAAGCSSEDPADDGPAHVESNAAAGARRVSEKLVRRAATPPLTPSGLTVDDGVVSSTPRDSDLILLSNGVERVSLRAKAKRTAALDSRPGIRLLHTRGPIPDALPRELANRGILVLGYVPNNTLVYYDTGLDRSVSKLTARADYARAWGLSDRTSAKVALSEPEQDVAVVVVRHAYAAPVRERVEREALLQYSAPTVLDAAVVYRVRLTRGTLDELRYSPEVLWIEPYSRPIPLDEVQGMILAGELTGETPIGPGYRAWLKEHGIGPSMLETVKVDVTDSGCDTGTPLPLLHQELGGVETILNHTSEPEGNDVGGHGTLNLSIVGGNPTDGALDDSGYLYGLGIAPGVRLGSSRVFDGHDRWDAWTTQTAIVSAAQAAGAQITSNSWGSEVLGYYTTESQEYDAIVRDADRDASTGLDPMVVVFSAGNSGPDPRTIGAPGTAKNVITVGASENYRMTGTDGCGIRNSGADSARELAAFSSRGPTVDGRLKPELVAPGTHVQGALTTDFDPAVASICDGPWPLTTPPQSLYGWSSGTSHSAPAVAGVSAITYAWYRSKYAAPPSPALVKAMLVGHATSLGGGKRRRLRGSLPDPVE